MIIVQCRVRLQKKSTVASELEFIKVLNVEILNIDLQDAILALGKIRLIAVEDTVEGIIIELSHPNPRLMPELQLKQVSEIMTVEQKNLYGKYFDQFATALNKIQDSGLPASEAAARVIEISEQVPAPIRAPLGKDAEELLQAVREKSDEELDTMKAQIFGFVNDAF